MSSYLLRILCLIVLSALYGCSSGSSEGGISGTGGPPKIIVNGQAEKGPFLKRSEVTYHYINEEGETLSENFSTVTTDDMGSFSLGLNDPGLIKIRVSGYHYDEINNQISDGLLTLNGLYIAGDEEGQAARVNLLTHIIHDRVLMLMADENLSAGFAVTQAEQELLGELESIIPKVGINDFSQLSVYNRESTNEIGNAYLLLFSAALYQHAINYTPQESSLSGQLTSILNVLTDDFEDGKLDASSQLIDGLALAIQQLDSAEIVSNLEGRSNDVLGETLEVPDFSGFIGQFLITFPAEDATLSEITPVRLEVPTGLKNVILELMVDGLVVDSITEAPYEFSWAPYYWSSESTSRHTILVKARNSFGAEIVSNLVAVSVLSESRDQLNLIHPTNGQSLTNTSEALLQWTALSGAAEYRVQVASDSVFATVIDDAVISENQYLATGLGVGTYYWRILAQETGGNAGVWSTEKSFIIAAPQVPTLSLPGNGSAIRNTDTPTLSWSTVESAENYHVQIAEHSDFSIFAQQQVMSTTNYTTTSLSAGTYYWRVKGINEIGYEGGFSSVYLFEVTGPESAHLLLPAEGSIISDTITPNLIWGAVQYAENYRIQLSNQGDFSVLLEEQIVPSTNFMTSSLDAGNYYWRVQSINNSGIIGDWSQNLGVFTVPLSITSQSINTDEDVDIGIEIAVNTDENVSYVIISQPKHGVIAGTFPSITYRPNEDFFGFDNIQLKAVGQGLESDTETINIEVNPINDAPTISGEPLELIKANEEYSYQLVVSDVDDNNLSYEGVNLPDWMTISHSGLLSGIPDNSQAGSYLDIRLSVNDGVYYVDFEPFSLTVEMNPWIPRTNMPLVKSGGAAAEYDGIIYYFGGNDSVVDFEEPKSTYAYNPLTNSWAKKASMPLGLYNLKAHTVGDRIYIMSEISNSSSRYEIYTLEYDPVNDKWKFKAPRPTLRYGFSSAEVNGLIYVIGGVGKNYDLLNGGWSWERKDYVEIYNPQTDSWSNGQPTPEILGGPSCALNENIYSFKGSDYFGIYPTTESPKVYVYDTNLNSWSSGQSMQGARVPADCAVIDNELYVFGGSRQILGRIDYVESYDPLTSNWSWRQSMTENRSSFPSVEYNGKVYVFGGFGELEMLDTVQMYDANFDM